MSDPFFTNSEFPDTLPNNKNHRRTSQLPESDQVKIKMLLNAAEQDRQKESIGPKKFKTTLKCMFVSWSTLGSLEMVGVPYATYGSLLIGFIYGITREI